MLTSLFLLTIPFLAPADEAGSTGSAPTPLTFDELIASSAAGLLGMTNPAVIADLKLFVESDPFYDTAFRELHAGHLAFSNGTITTESMMANGFYSMVLMAGRAAALNLKNFEKPKTAASRKDSTPTWFDAAGERFCEVMLAAAYANEALIFEEIKTSKVKHLGAPDTITATDFWLQVRSAMGARPSFTRTVDDRKFPGRAAPVIDEKTGKAKTKGTLGKSWPVQIGWYDNAVRYIKADEPEETTAAAADAKVQTAEVPEDAAGASAK